MLNRDLVVARLTYIATMLRRKIDQRILDGYHRELDRLGMTDDQFTMACQDVIDEDDRFPSIKRLRELGRQHRRHERGVPFLRDGFREEIGMLSECLAALDDGRTYGGSDQYRGRQFIKPMIEELIYLDAATTVEPVAGEPHSSRLKRIVAKAEAEIASIQGKERASRPNAATEGPR